MGVFSRGPGLNLTSGQYTAPVSGFYALAATLHVGEARGMVVGRLLPGPDSTHVTTSACVPCSAHRAAAKRTAKTSGPSTPADLHPVSLSAQRVSASVESLLHSYYHWGVGDP